MSEACVARRVKTPAFRNYAASRHGPDGQERIPTGKIARWDFSPPVLALPYQRGNLPVPRATATGRKAMNPARDSRAKILVVEDEPELAAEVDQTLVELGYNVVGRA